MTNDEKNLELMQRAVDHFKIHVPPDGVKEAAAIAEYYAIFKSSARWKAGIRTPEESLTVARKLGNGFKRSREKLAAH